MLSLYIMCLDWIWDELIYQQLKFKQFKQLKFKLSSTIIDITGWAQLLELLYLNSNLLIRQSFILSRNKLEAKAMRCRYNEIESE